MMKFKKGLLTLTVISGCLPLWGTQSENHDDFYLTIERLISESPALKSFSAEKDAVIAEASILDNLPDPEIEGEYLRGTNGSNKWNAGITWNLEWPGVYSARNKEGKAAADTEKIRFELQRRQVRLDVSRAAVNYLKARKRVRVIKKLLESTDSIAAIVESGIRLGHLTSLDANKISIEKARLDLRLTEEEQAMSEYLSDMTSICGNQALNTISTSIIDFPEGTPERKDYYLSRINSYPEIRLAQAEILQSEAAYNSAKSEALPSLSIGYRHAYEEETHFNGAALGLSLPIFSSSGKKKAAQAKRKAAELTSEAQQEALTAQVSSLADRLNALQDAISQTEPVFKNDAPQQLLLKAYINGRLSLLEYLQERSYYTEAELDLIDLQASRAILLQTLNSL